MRPAFLPPASTSGETHRKGQLGIALSICPDVSSRFQLRCSLSSDFLPTAVANWQQNLPDTTGA